MRMTTSQLVTRLAAKTGLKRPVLKEIVTQLFETVSIELLNGNEVELPDIAVLSIKYCGNQIRRNRTSGGPTFTRTKPRYKMAVSSALKKQAVTVRDLLATGDPLGHIMPDGTCCGVKVVPEGWKFSVTNPDERWFQMWERLGLIDYVTVSGKRRMLTLEESQDAMRAYLKKEAARKLEAAERLRQRAESKAMRNKMRGKVLAEPTQRD